MTIEQVDGKWWQRKKRTEVPSGTILASDGILFKYTAVIGKDEIHFASRAVVGPDRSDQRDIYQKEEINYKLTQMDIKRKCENLGLENTTFRWKTTRVK